MKNKNKTKDWKERFKNEIPEIHGRRLPKEVMAFIEKEIERASLKGRVDFREEEHKKELEAYRASLAYDIRALCYENSCLSTKEMLNEILSKLNGVINEFEKTAKEKPKRAVMEKIKHIIYGIILPLYLWSIVYKTLEEYILAIEKDYERFREKQRRI